jgi:transposase
MDTAISTRIRQAIVRLHQEEHRSYEEIAELLQVGRATVSRVLRRSRETGGVDRLPRGGGNLSPIHGRIAGLLGAVVSKMPDATVAELTAALVERADITTSRSAVLRALGRLGYSRKESRLWRSSGTAKSTAPDDARSAPSSRR